MRKNIMLTSLAMMAAMSQNFEPDYYEPEHHKPAKRKPAKTLKPLGSNDLPIPKGHIMYWFREDGTYINESMDCRMEKSECVFDCFAGSKKAAIKRFNNRQKQNQN